MIETMRTSSQSSLVQGNFKPSTHLQHLPKNSMTIHPSLGKQTKLYVPTGKPALAVLPTNAISIKKPMRRLTAYHIFFQIEREYIIQTLGGEDADKLIQKEKQSITDVPGRYKKIKLSLNWYAGPGKRKKRKHRKSHGKIGFLELSRQIATRWAKLEEIDPETRHFVKDIAESELKEYQCEMQEYKKRKENNTTTTSKTASSSLTNEVVVKPLPPLSVRRAHQHYHPCKKSCLNHQQEVMHFQPQQKSCQPASVLPNSVSELIAADFDNNCRYSSTGINADVEYFHSSLVEEEQRRSLMRQDASGSINFSDEMCNEILNRLSRNGANWLNESPSQGSSCFKSISDPCSTWLVLDCDQSTKKFDVSNYADVDDDYIVELWNS